MKKCYTFHLISCGVLYKEIMKLIKKIFGVLLEKGHGLNFNKLKLHK